MFLTEYNILAIREADTILIAVGEGWYVTGEARSLSNVELDNYQVEYAKKAKSFGKKVIAIVFAACPLAITELALYADAILYAWYPGIMGGSAVAEILFGKFNPCGRLPVTIPRNTGQIPIYYNFSNNARLFNVSDQ